LYSTQNGCSFNADVLSEISNIAILKKHIDNSAVYFQDTPPIFTLSVFLVPDWHFSNFNHASYHLAKEAFLNAVQNRLQKEKLDNIQLDDFYESLNESKEYQAVKEYLVNLTGVNNVPDIMKIQVIVRNNDSSHLQIDSNTQIHDHRAFYQATFGSQNHHPILLNAAFYGEKYIGAHNKLVYTSEHSEFQIQLKQSYLIFCSTYKTISIKSKKNIIYSNLFLKTLELYKLVSPLTFVDAKTQVEKTIYPADLSRSEFQLSRFVITIVNLQFKIPKETGDCESALLKKIPMIKIGDALCGYAAFRTALKRLTGNIGLHKYAGNSKQFIQDLLETNTQKINEDTAVRRQLFCLSRPDLDKKIIADFCSKAIEFTKTMQEKTESFRIMSALVHSIPSNVLGAKLTFELFGCTLEELYNNPFLIEEKFMSRKTLTTEEMHYRDVYCKPDLKFQETLLSELGDDFKDMATLLDQNGIIALPAFFSGDALHQMQADFDGWCSKKMPDVHNHIQFGGTVEETYLTDSKTICQAVTHPFITTLGAYAWGHDTTLSSIRAYRIYPTAPKKYRAFQPHNDGHGKEYKVMLLLTDVEKGGQGMRYWPGTHTIDWEIHSSRDTLYTDNEIAQLPEPFECSGPAGTLFIFNINGIHSGVRNEGATRDTVVWSISAGKRLYPVPALHSAVTSELTDYEKTVFRCGKENELDEVEGELAAQPKNVLVDFLKKNKNVINLSAQRFLSKIEPKKTLRVYGTTNPFQLPVSPQKKLLDCSHADFLTTNEITEVQLKLSLSENPRRGIDLPIRLYSGIRDKSRDLALCFIRDTWLSNEREGIIFKKLLPHLDHQKMMTTDKLKTYQNHCSNSLELLSCPESAFSMLSVKKFDFINFISDLDWCLKTAESYSLISAELSLLLATLDYLIEKSAHPKLKEALEEQFFLVARCYIGHIKLDQLHKQQIVGGTEFQKYIEEKPKTTQTRFPLSACIDSEPVILVEMSATMEFFFHAEKLSSDINPREWFELRPSHELMRILESFLKALSSFNGKIKFIIFDRENKRRSYFQHVEMNTQIEKIKITLLALFKDKGFENSIKEIEGVFDAYSLSQLIHIYPNHLLLLQENSGFHREAQEYSIPNIAIHAEINGQFHLENLESTVQSIAEFSEGNNNPVIYLSFDIDKTILFHRQIFSRQNQKALENYASHMQLEQSSQFFNPFIFELISLMIRQINTLNVLRQQTEQKPIQLRIGITTHRMPDQALEKFGNQINQMKVFNIVSLFIEKIRQTLNLEITIHSDDIFCLGAPITDESGAYQRTKTPPEVKDKLSFLQKKFEQENSLIIHIDDDPEQQDYFWQLDQSKKRICFIKMEQKKAERIHLEPLFSRWLDRLSTDSSRATCDTLRSPCLFTPKSKPVAKAEGDTSSFSMVTL